MSGSAFLSAISTIGTIAFQLAFEISPILLVGGIAGQFQGAAIPIVSLTEAPNFVLGLLTGNNPLELDRFFAHFQPLPGSTLLDLQLGTYPFANQAVAANAVIMQPLTLSYLMRCPARGAMGYLAKLGTMINLKNMLTQHATLGGTYTCLTPAGYYPNGILKTLRDASDTESKQPQNAYQWDFEFPLLTLEQAQAAQNSLMSKLTAQTQITGFPAFSGGASTVGIPSSLATPSVISAASGLDVATVPGFS